MDAKPELTNFDHDKMDAFLGNVLDDYRAGKITKSQAVNGLAHVMAALDHGNYAEVRSWFENGNTFITQNPISG